MSAPHDGASGPGLSPPPLDPHDVARLLRRCMLEQDLSLKEAAGKLARSIGTVKRALNGSMGPRTAYRIVQEFQGVPH